MEMSLIYVVIIRRRVISMMIILLCLMTCRVSRFLSLCCLQILLYSYYKEAHTKTVLKPKKVALYPEVIDLDSEDICTPHDLLPKEAYFVEKNCDLEHNQSEIMNYKDPEAEKIEYDPRLEATPKFL